MVSIVGIWSFAKPMSRKKYLLTILASSKPLFLTLFLPGNKKCRLKEFKKIALQLFSRRKKGGEKHQQMPQQNVGENLFGLGLCNMIFG